jgi:hypothetical protein
MAYRAFPGTPPRAPASNGFGRRHGGALRGGDLRTMEALMRRRSIEDDTGERDD